MDSLVEYVQLALKRVIEQQGFQDYETQISSATNKGDNFGGILYRIEITGKRNGVDANLDLVCKVPIENFELNLKFGFQRETHMYQHVLRNFKKFQDDKNLSSQEIFSSHVLCFEANSNSGKEYIIMEDLKTNSFKMLNKLSKIDRQHAELVVKALAEFHALSFAMKDQRPEEFQKISDIPEVLIGILSEKAFFDMCDFGLNQCLLALENCDPEYKDKVTKVQESMKDLVQTCLRAVGSEDYCVINHSDCWNNNMMFRYVDNKPVEIRLFDWQLSRFCSPVIDLVNYFYNSTEKELLEDHFDELMSIYHNHLSAFIRSLGSNPQRLYPYEQFQKDLKKFAVFPFIACCSNLTILLSNPDKLPDLGEMGKDDFNMDEILKLKDEERQNLYGIRIRDIVKHAIDRGFI